MRYGILSDIHANLEAVQAVMHLLQTLKIERLVVAGDTVGYGTNPVECVALMEGAGAIQLKGNHEEGLLTGDFSRFVPEAAETLRWTTTRIPPEMKARIDTWQDEFSCEDFVACHGSPQDRLHYYIRGQRSAEPIFDNFSFDVLFVGHTHFPCAFRRRTDTAGKPEIIAEEPGGSLAIILDPGVRYIINVGSVGQPRDGNPQACCGFFDTDVREFKLFRVPYDVETAWKKILDAGLPASVAGRILRGI
jgi:diadenosine tetraphosphatase ApaH/serine/threonine PP2A family protein phosphatase